MEVGPPGSPCRRRAQTAAVSCRSRAGVGSDCGKGPPTAGQVSDEKTNVSEPLMTHRNSQRRHRNRGSISALGQRHARRQALSQEAACVLAWRCPVYRWRELAAGTGREQENLSPRCRRPVEMGGCCAPWLRKGDPQVAETARGRVPMRGTGTGRLAVARKAL